MKLHVVGIEPHAYTGGLGQRIFTFDVEVRDQDGGLVPREEGGPNNDPPRMVAEVYATLTPRDKNGKALQGGNAIKDDWRLLGSASYCVFSITERNWKNKPDDVLIEVTDIVYPGYEFDAARGENVAVSTWGS